MFFALWPDAAAGAQLGKLSGALHDICGGRRTRTETIHLTLVFLGEVEINSIPGLIELAAGIGAPSFELDLARLGWWPHNKIAWAAPAETPEELGLLVRELRDRLRAEGFGFDRKAFVPHITLLRKANCKKELLPDAGIEWRVEDFVLVRSVPGESGSAYEIVGRWPLL